MEGTDLATGRKEHGEAALAQQEAENTFLNNEFPFQLILIGSVNQKRDLLMTKFGDFILFLHMFSLRGKKKKKFLDLD